MSSRSDEEMECDDQEPGTSSGGEGDEDEERDSVSDIRSPSIHSNEDLNQDDGDASNPMSPDVTKSDDESQAEHIASRSIEDDLSSSEETENTVNKKQNVELDDGDSQPISPKNNSEDFITSHFGAKHSDDSVVKQEEADTTVDRKGVSKVPRRGALDDHEGELDFEEEVNDERRDETESIGDPEKSQESDSQKKKENVEDASKDEGKEDLEDDGELEDDDDLEEGEVKEISNDRKAKPKPICRFFNKGQCTWGSSCRFLHPGVNDKGNYNMFTPSKPLVPSNGPGMTGNTGPGWQGNPRLGYGRRNSVGVEVLPPPPPPPAPFETTPIETAWERGLRHAKEILKKSNKRKEMEPDFDEKRLNMGLSGSDGPVEYEKENDFYGRSPYMRNSDPYYAYGYDDFMDSYERQAQDYWRGGNYENFEVRYTRIEPDYKDHNHSIRNRIHERDRGDMYKDKNRDRERGWRDKFDRMEPHRSPDRGWRDSRFSDAPNNRARGDEWRDPWRRSTTPKRRGGSRSYSSHSSASYSSSSRSRRSSSYSSSRSSSASSYSSYSSPSRSPSHSKQPVKRKEVQAEPVRKSKVDPVKQSYPPPHKSAKMSSRQTNPPPTHAHSRAPLPHSRVPEPAPMPANQDRARRRPEKLPSRSQKAKSPSGSESDSRSSDSQSDTSSHSSKRSIPDNSPRTGHWKDDKRIKVVDLTSSHEPRKLNSEKPRGPKVDAAAVDSNKVKSAVNQNKTSKDPLKQSGHKQQIKLTLLQKPAEKISVPVVSPIKKEPIDRKLKPAPPIEEKEFKPIPITPSSSTVSNTNNSTSSSSSSSNNNTNNNNNNNSSSSSNNNNNNNSNTSNPRKRPLSPTPDTTSAKTASTNVSTSATKQVSVSSSTSKKSTSSRREELLRQLKAIEDAIARKRAKPS